MARPLPLPEPRRNGTNGTYPGRTASGGPLHLHAAMIEEAQGAAGRPEAPPEEGEDAPAGDVTVARDVTGAAEAAELEHLRSENAQLRVLCLELEQALQEAAQQCRPDLEQQIKEYDAILEEKSEIIRQLHQQLQDTQAALQDAEARAAQPAEQPAPGGSAPVEHELLALSEELERERRQLQEDEQTLMEQMREMEVSMARERAGMARQRNDLQRLQGEIRHELERLERNGALQSKIDGLKNKLQDVTARRGAAPVPVAHHPTAHPVPTAAPTAAPSRKEGLMGRLFGQGGK
jgi:hypothetical protein